ncbi:DUF2851 family protein [Pontibacter vulgaris]|uniref:DUF2851 family protein n=1 Tax=Pontibacter vulgaris TaxID=2905679 RepID=UPI001FA77370|nr:DUF2851 family protein [Pontibacter vulgaris]
MKEEFLHYIWQHQYFDKADLATVEGEPVQVVRVGFYNTDSGPDFKEAKLRIGEVEWAGSIEIHLRASDWQRHGHEADQKYDQIILHVVWEDDAPITRTDGSLIPTIALKGKIDLQLLNKYKQLQLSQHTIPCENYWPLIPEITKTMMLERALVERLEQKGEEVLQVYQSYGNDWEQTAYHILCKGFGFKINQEAFERLAKALPLSVVRRQQSMFQVEALLYGMAGFLEIPEAKVYVQQLAKEFSFLQHKYKLGEKGLQRHHWNFLRMRPANFPTVRLAQLAAILFQPQAFFSKVLTAQTIKEYEVLFMVPVSAYWQQHYDIGKPTKALQAGMGKSSAHNLIINVAVPLLAAYANYTGERSYLEKAIELLEKVKEASNKYTRLYEELGWSAKSAADNQAALGLFRNYCQPVNCLYCSIGNKILKQTPTA